MGDLDVSLGRGLQHALGVLFLVVGLISLAVLNLADWLLPGRDAHIGWMQIAASIPALLTVWAGTALAAGGRRAASGTRERPARILGTIMAPISAALMSISLASGPPPPYDKVTGLPKLRTNVIRVAGLAGTAVCRCLPNVTERIRLPGGFATQVAIYARGDAGPRPGVVIAHGNTWMGGDLPTYRLLATQLARRGLIVMTVDFPGFGKSDDPFGRGPAAVADANDSVAILNAAIAHLVASTNVDRSNVIAFGHSGGVDPAMRVAESNPLVSRVAVMVAPPPPVFGGADLQDREKYAAQRGQYFSRRFAEQYRYVYGKDPPQSRELSRPERYTDDVWAAYRRPGHSPLLLILGERDEPSGHAAVLHEFGVESPTKEVFVLPRSDHYLNTAQWLGLLFYDADVARSISDKLVAWVTATSADRNGGRQD
jgi:pimeloyl-ACP methyl ester carboxylesterase